MVVTTASPRSPFGRFNAALERTSVAWQTALATASDETERRQDLIHPKKNKKHPKIPTAPFFPYVATPFLPYVKN